MQVDLIPCPFCGGEPYYRKPEHMNGTAFDIMRIECKHCGASPYAVQVYEYDTLESKQMAIAEMWNRRISSDCPDVLRNYLHDIKRLKEILKQSIIDWRSIGERRPYDKEAWEMVNYEA